MYANEAINGFTLHTYVNIINIQFIEQIVCFHFKVFLAAMKLLMLAISTFYLSKLKNIKEYC